MPIKNDPAVDRPELLEVYGRRRQKRWTAKAGVLAGLLLGFLLAVVIGYLNQMRYQQAANDQMREQAQACMQTVREKDSELQRLQLSMQESARGRPVLELQKAQRDGLARIKAIAAELPVFKTEAYKLIGDKLNAELLAQTSAAAELSALLEEGYRTETPLCAVTKQAKAGGKPIWARGAIALYKDGWMLDAATQHPTPVATPGEVK